MGLSRPPANALSQGGNMDRTEALRLAAATGGVEVAHFGGVTRSGAGGSSYYFTNDAPDNGVYVRLNVAVSGRTAVMGFEKIKKVVEFRFVN